MVTMKRVEIPATTEEDNTEVILPDPMVVLRRLQQLGDRGLQAAMDALAKDTQ